MPVCWISLGTNLNRESSLFGSLATLHDCFGSLQVSSIYETAAVGNAGPDFLNAVLGIKTTMPLTTLITQLHQIELSYGRVRTENKFAPRPLDLDLLTYGDRVQQETKPLLPHPDILRYNFVLAPLAEIAPEVFYPQSTQTYAQLWADYPHPDEPPLRLWRSKTHFEHQYHCL
jgi:2-amino-4-hydroxy-6-hydroxymethyldihydropteridine diphosphokinase